MDGERERGATEGGRAVRGAWPCKEGATAVGAFGEGVLAEGGRGGGGRGAWMWWCNRIIASLMRSAADPWQRRDGG